MSLDNGEEFDEFEHDPIDIEAFERFQEGGLRVVGKNVARHKPRRRTATTSPEGPNA